MFLMLLPIVFVFAYIRPITLIKYEMYSDWLKTEKSVFFFFFLVFTLPHKSDNELPDQLTFSIKSYTVCTKPELRIIEGIIVALQWFDVACWLTDWLTDTDTYTYMNSNY